MLTDCPDPREVADFHFLQLRSLRIAKLNKNIPEKSGNILAAASKYGLLFIGTEGGFNVIKLETILTLDEDKENRSIVENYSYDFVPCGTPVTLAVNATQTMLAVCVKCGSNIIINLYSLSSNCGSGNVWQPFCTNASSPSGAEVWDFVWNPAVEGWYVVCFSDGSLQIHEVSGISIKVVGALQGTNAVAVCWSPKGKQLVAGKQNGTFTQYKPNLTEVKTIPPPGVEESLVSITSICWIANTLFAVVYVVGDTPNLFTVSTPKDSVCVYTNFYDVCLGNNCAPHQRYLLHLEPSWKILVCASLDSIEIAVLGDMPNWVQWDLKEDGKALLPGKDGATHAVGMTVMYSAQRQLVISESESYPPMPILFLLTNNGLLVSFHMINANPAAASLIYAPLPLENVNSSGDGVSVAGPPVILKQTPSNPLMSSTFIVGNPAAGDQSLLPPSRESANIPTTQTFGKGESSATHSITEQKESPNLFGDGVHVKKPEDAAISQIQKSAISGHMGITPLHSGAEKQNEVQSSTQNSYMTAIITEIQSFVKELQDLKQLQSSSPTIDGEEDMVSLKKYALNLHNFQKNILETMQSISSDIYTLKNVLLESFVMLEEACSRERRRNDHSFITMLKERALDPITAKRMQKMNQHYQYLNTQMQEVSDKLDQDWINLCSTKKKSNKSNLCISSTEAIYKTIVNNQKIIHNLRKKVEMLMKKSEERKLRNITKSASWGRYHKRSMQEDLSRLADEFLQVKITHLEEGGEPTVTKKLSSESQTVIKAFLKQSSIVTVRPTAVYSPSQSRLLSNAAPSEDFSGSEHGHEKDVSPKEINTPTKEKEVSKLISPPSEVQIPKINSKMTFSFERTPNQSAPIGPVYEPITPPDVMNSTVPVNKPSTTSNMPVPSLINEKHPEQQAYNQPLFKGTNTVDSSVSSSTERDQRIGSNILSNFKSNIEGPPNISCPLNFNQTSSENVSATSTSLFYPKTLSFASSTQKVTENATSKPLAVSSNTMVSSVVSSFQFMSSFGPKKEIAFSSPPPNNSTVSSNKISSQLESKIISESSQFCQPEVSLSPLTANTLNVPVSQNSSFSTSMTNPTQISGPSSFILPETKNSTLITVSGGKDQSDAKTSVGFFLQKPSDDVGQPDILVLKKDATSGNSSQTAAENISVLSLAFNKTDSVDSKSPGSRALNSQCRDVDKSVITQSSSILPNQTSFTTVQKTEDLVTTNSQPTITVSNLLDLKQSLSPSEVSTSEPSVVSTVVTSNSVSETAQSIVPLPASSADMTKSDFTTSVTSTANIPQSDLATSKPSTPPMPVLSPITTTSTQILFGQNTVVTSAGNSDLTASKTESSPTSVFVKPLFGQSAAETSLFGAANTFGQTSVTQSTSFGQTATSTTFPSVSGGFFSQMSSTFGTPAAATSTTNSSDFNSQTATFSFGKPTFGQTTGTFGLAKSFFGQNTTPFTQAGSSTSFSFNQNSSSMFGQGSFFSGLGGKASEENASKNVFGLSSNVKLNTDTSSLFRNSSVTSFGTVNSGSFSTPGSFSSGGGSVAQAGFGSFQQNTVPQTGFVSAPSFGGAPAFGSPPAFGGSPTFGSGNPLSPSVFGQQVSSNFSTFANASSPTFGSLASQTPSFGNSSGGFASQGTGFGSPSVFGGSSFGGQSSSFGNPGSPPSNSSAFTQWRN